MAATTLESKTKPSSIHQPHDGIFRAALSDIEVVKDFLACYLPDSASGV